MPPTAISQLAGRRRRNLDKAIHTHGEIARRPNGRSRRRVWRNRRCIKQNDVVWAAWHARVLASACRAWLALKPGAKHSSLAGPAASFVPSNLSVARLLVPDCRMTRLCSRTTFCRSPPSRRPRELKIGASRPAYPKTYPHKFQRCKNVPSTTRSRTPRSPGPCSLGNSPAQGAANDHASSHAH